MKKMKSTAEKKGFGESLTKWMAGKCLSKKRFHRKIKSYKSTQVGSVDIEEVEIYRNW